MKLLFHSGLEGISRGPHSHQLQMQIPDKGGSYSVEDKVGSVGLLAESDTSPLIAGVRKLALHTQTEADLLTGGSQFSPRLLSLSRSVPISK